ncbi:TetR/AcrR family transcriptional regulator [Streptomyces sp. NPDC047046]|uniref:TetR/AcrR family transcriptional regulator n=1 Tax=Streptomyces sp. NPDC047046 TaxID=3155378 RepID=UPI0033D60663
MPRLSEDTRARRREHILTSAWACFSRDGFHAASMDDVIAATGVSSSAVYRYFRSKEELIDATAEVGLGLVRDIFARSLEARPTPGPGRTLAMIVDELRGRTEHPDYDLSKLAMQTWAEALRRPPLRERTRALYAETQERLAELAVRWKGDGHLPANAEPEAAAAVIFALMHGLIVCHHLADDVSTDALVRGLIALGAGIAGERPTAA